MLMPFSIVSGIGLAILAPWLLRLFKQRGGLVMAVLVAGGLALFAMQIPAIADGSVVRVGFPWIPSLNLAFSFHLDGLSLLFCLLIIGIGSLVLLYGGSYLQGHPALTRFFSITLLFMSAMAGLVLSGNALLLFLFWEMTSITSFLLIGFEHKTPAARAAAWQALLVTGAGGLAMLAGFVLLFEISGSFEIQEWIQSAGQIQQHPLAPAAFVLILLGAMSKSAQFPFHFWLPNAMQAPTPVSAYLHSATMVKAGVYLLARLFPVFSGLELWGPTVSLVGLVTLLAGSLLALGQSDLKRLLAYTTVAALGSMVMLLGLGTPLAVKTGLAFLFAHALYKGALFLVAGGVDHAVHSRDVRELGGLGRAMPWTALAAALAGLSMAGLPPFFGFITKELVYETLLQTSRLPGLLTGAVLISFVAWVAVSGWVGLTPFWGRPGREFHAHKEPVSLWLPPLILASLGLAAGLFPQAFADGLLKSATEALLLSPQKIKLSLWHGLTPMLGLSLLTVALGLGLFAARRWILAGGERFWQAVAAVGPANLYQKGLKGILSFAAWLTRVLQSGYLRVYILFIVLFTILLTFFSVWSLLEEIPLPRVDAPRFYDVILVAIIIIAAIQVTRTRSRLATIAMLGSIGYSIAILFLLYSGPDLAMVQFAMETLTVILFVLIIYRLPKFARLSGKLPRVVDGLVALAGGALMTVLMLLVSNHPSNSNLANYYANASLSQANGRNIVNVILVDFRGLDTLGEIAVLSIAAIGVFALLSLNNNKPGQRPKETAKLQRSILLGFSARYMVPLMVIFSFFLLIRGHNQIGGGFVGGLVAASALMLYAIATSPAELRKLLPVEPRSLVGSGLLVALFSGLISLLAGQPFMTGLWLKKAVLVIGKVGTPVLFDVGVYLVVVGIVLWILLTFSEETP